MNDAKEYKLLGVGVTPQTLEELLATISNSVDHRQPLIVASQNLHSVYTYHKSQALRGLHEVAIKRVDGMPLIYFGRVLGYPVKREQRITWVDLMYPLIQEATDNQWKVFYLGADEQSVSKGVEILKQKYPSLNITYRNGFFDVKKDGQENQYILKQIAEYQPDILIVGMGMPRQEKWILENREQLDVPVIMTCGAAIEYVAGTVRTPPRWMGRVGLEWFYRLQENPRRFAFRYLVEPWYILSLALRDLTKKFIFRKSL